MLAAYHEKVIMVNDQLPHLPLSISCKSDSPLWGSANGACCRLRCLWVAVIVMQMILVIGRIQFIDLLSYVNLQACTKFGEGGRTQVLIWRVIRNSWWQFEHGGDEGWVTLYPILYSSPLALLTVCGRVDMHHREGIRKKWCNPQKAGGQKYSGTRYELQIEELKSICLPKIERFSK